MAKPLIKKIDFTKNNLGLSSTSFKSTINRITRSIIATGDKQQVNKAIRLALRVNEGKKISKNSIYDLIAEGGKIVNKKDGTRELHVIGGSGNQKSNKAIQVNLTNKRFENLVNAGVLNAKTANNIKKAIQKKKTRKPKKIDVNREDIKNIFDIIQNMGGIAIALDKYYEDVERLCNGAGITVDELIDAY